MDKEDARTQSREVLHERRKQVIRLHRRGLGTNAIAKATGLNWGTVNNAIRLYESAGAKALVPAARGKKHGSGRVLSQEQEAQIRQLICDKRPEQLKMDFALWTRAAVQLLIERQFAVSLSIRSVGQYLSRWGFTPQKPIKRAYEQRPEAVKAWLDEQYPIIAKRARAEGAEIHWGDETSVVNNDVRGRSFAPAGQTPVAYTVGGTYERLSMISSVSNQGKMHWMMIKENFNSERLIEFMAHLVADSTKKVFLILDNLRVHHSKPVKAWVEAHKDQIELFYLPSYSPELNPDERLNADLKHAIGTKVTVRTRTRLEQATTEHMNSIATNPQRVKAYFQDPRVRYAA